MKYSTACYTGLLAGSLFVVLACAFGRTAAFSFYAAFSFFMLIRTLRATP